MTGSVYFETPERAERAQLLVHLINNAETVLYLRGPRGAGKTRFMQQLLATLEPDYEITWQSGADGASIESAPSAPSQRPLVSGDSELDLLIQSQVDRPTLRIIDDADTLGPAELEQLRSFDPARQRIVLLGNGGPTLGLGDLQLQCVDLPAFTEDQSRAFLRAQAGGSEGVFDESLVASLHRASGGQPGPLLDALAGLPPPNMPGAKGLKQLEPRRASLNWRLIGIAASLLLLLVLVLLFQDRINALFAPSGDGVELVDEEPAIDSEPASGVVDAAGTGADLAAGAAMDPASTARPDEDFRSAVRAMPPVESAPGLVADPAPPEDRDAGQEAPSDPILDAVIDAAILAAEQPPQPPQPPADGEGPAAGAPVEKTPEPATQATVPEKRKAAGKPPPPEKKVLKVARGDTGLGWLRSRSPGRYTLQLVGSRDRSSIDRFIRKHGITRPYAVFARDLGGQPWHSLVAGDYPDRDSALAARRNLPKALSGVWPRTFGSIQQQLAER